MKKMTDGYTGKLCVERIPLQLNQWGWHREKCEWGIFPSPPAFKGRRWGNPPHLHFSAHLLYQQNHKAAQCVQNIIASIMVALIYFYCKQEGAAQRNFTQKQLPSCLGSRSTGPGKLISEQKKKKTYNALLRSTLHQYDRNKWKIPWCSRWYLALIGPQHDCDVAKNNEREQFPSPPSFKGRRWGKYPFLSNISTDVILKWSIQIIIHAYTHHSFYIRFCATNG